LTDDPLAVGIANRKIVQRHDASATFRTGDLVWLSPRPESIELAPPVGETNSINKIHGKISAAAYQGAFVEYESPRRVRS
jgi:hypothetical protein